MAGDEQVRARIMQARQTLELTPDECWRLLRGTSLGRVVFTMSALPAIRPVNHLIDQKTIIIRSHLGAAIAGHASQDGAVVCYEADDIDPNGTPGGASSQPGSPGWSATPSRPAVTSSRWSRGPTARWTRSSP